MANRQRHAGTDRALVPPKRNSIVVPATVGERLQRERERENRRNLNSIIHQYKFV